MADMAEQKNKRNRCVSFSTEEKLLIANICARYKHILENKKTDNVSSALKNKIWGQIADEVNSSATNVTVRTPEVLKRFYENRKREVRKIAADEKKQIFATGGGQVPIVKKDPCHDIILSVMNSKTVHGLPTLIDGDTEPEESSQQDFSEAEPAATSTINNEVEFEFISDYIEQDNETPCSEQMENTWRKYIPSDLKKPISESLTLNIRNQKDSSSLNLKRRNDTLDNCNTEGNTPKSKKMIPLPTSRRRPTTVVKALTRSELAEKYDTLLDRRLELVSLHQQKAEAEIEAIKREQGLKCELLELQIAIERAKLQKLT